ncbi:motility associated factor glycosyltransferase family protein [Calidifontibacillus erzurumensis]|uniref:DUF115 domain-containing protein n=1 Tax=Calidifontibacillus erzurumensis TaxID=2741433 RepID=A0A8J8KBN0_9BACI|nr:6-hydroxymethylpterin diphosphokinase MptE-like protein [Calidifontibacillus erzurumensis]NSL51787.1 DUF115 domain-containing protein [Calidifontibacillus erzurumensis]
MNNICIADNDEQRVNENIIMLKSKSGLPIMKFNGLFLNSQYSPIKEAELLAEHHYKKNHVHILFGLSSSYLAIELLKKIDESDFLLIIEPSKNLFDRVKKLGLLSQLINHPNVFFIVGFDEKKIEAKIEYLIHTKYMAQVEFIVSPNYEKIYPIFINVLKDIIKKNVYLALVNINTMTLFSKVWQENLLCNLKELWKSLPFENFKNKLNCPVIIASSGPSLTKQLDLLKLVKENESALIIAAGSTINPLLNAGIQPHLIVSIDGGVGNWEHFKNIQYDNIPLFYSLVVHKDIPKKHTGIKVAFNKDDKQLEKWVNKTIGKELGFVKGGSSVANDCFFIAKNISTGPIAFIGQDLAYTNNLTHAEGNRNLKSVNQYDFQNNKRFVKLKGYYGDEVNSDYVFLGMKKTFEDMVITFRNEGDLRPIFNCTEGGVFIEGFENLPFKQFVDTYCTQNHAVDFQNLFAFYKHDLNQKQFIEENLKLEKKNLERVVDLSKEAMDIIKNVKGEHEKIDEEILTKLDEIDSKLVDCVNNNILVYIVNPIIFRVNYLYQEGKNESREEFAKRILNKSEALYSGILKATESTLKIFEKVLTRNC